LVIIGGTCTGRVCIGGIEIGAILVWNILGCEESIG
jgi:hypothetical protein